MKSEKIKNKHSWLDHRTSVLIKQNVNSLQYNERKSGGAAIVSDKRKG